jgi:hypothetical protein
MWGEEHFDPFTPHTHKLAAASPFYPFFFPPFDDTHTKAFSGFVWSKGGGMECGGGKDRRM